MGYRPGVGGSAPPESFWLPGGTQNVHELRVTHDGYSALLENTAGGNLILKAALNIIFLRNDGAPMAMFDSAGRLALGTSAFVRAITETTNYLSVVTCEEYSGTGGAFAYQCKTPPLIDADQHDFSPGLANVVELESDGLHAITGWSTAVGIPLAIPVFVLNVGANPIEFTHEDVQSAEANRFICPGGLSFTLAPEAMLLVLRAPNLQRWRVLPLG